MKFGSARWTLWGRAERGWSKTVMGSVSASSVRRAGVGGAAESRPASNAARARIERSGQRDEEGRTMCGWVCEEDEGRHERCEPCDARVCFCCGGGDGGRGEYELSSGAEKVRDVGAGEELWAQDVEDEGCGMCGLGRVSGAGCTAHESAT
jgi:hypothetical protein